MSQKEAVQTVLLWGLQDLLATSGAPMPILVCQPAPAGTSCLPGGAIGRKIDLPLQPKLRILNRDGKIS